MDNIKKIKILLGTAYIIILSLFLWVLFSNFSIKDFSSYEIIKSNTDILNNLGPEDRIFMHGLGISDISLTYGATSHHGISGIGIYANGTLEALVTGNFNTAQIDSMTTGGFFA